MLTTYYKHILLQKTTQGRHAKHINFLSNLKQIPKDKGEQRRKGKGTTVEVKTNLYQQQRNIKLLIFPPHQKKKKTDFHIIVPHQTLSSSINNADNTTEQRKALGYSQNKQAHYDGSQLASSPEPKITL
jgi:hypothetical protein